MRAAAAEANQGVKMMFLVVGDDGLGGVDFLAAHQHAARLVAAGAEDGAADGENAGKMVQAERSGAVLHQPAKAVAEADERHAENALGGLAHAADGGVEARAIAAGGEDADVFGGGSGHLGEGLRRSQPSTRRAKAPGFSPKVFLPSLKACFCSRVRLAAIRFDRRR